LAEDREHSLSERVHLIAMNQICQQGDELVAADARRERFGTARGA
jgi:hypothetical protein